MNHNCMTKLVLCSALILGITSCSSEDDPGKACAVGTETCACTAGGACDPGLRCLSMRCVRPGDGGAGAGGSGGVAGTGGIGGAGAGGTGGGGTGGGGVSMDGSTVQMPDTATSTDVAAVDAAPAIPDAGVDVALDLAAPAPDVAPVVPDMAPAKVGMGGACEQTTQCAEGLQCSVGRCRGAVATKEGCDRYSGMWNGELCRVSCMNADDCPLAFERCEELTCQRRQ